MSEPTERTAARLDPGIPIVILASACWETPAPVNVHHIARRFAARGHDVLFVESTGLRSPSVRSAHDLSRIRRRLAGWRAGPRRVDDHLFVLSPLALPWNWPRPARKGSMRWIALTVRRAVKELNLDRPVLWSFLPTYLRTRGRIPHRLFIYQCVDDFSGNPGVDVAWLETLERNIVEQSDLVLATSPVLVERLGAIRDDVVLTANVADVDLFRTAVTDDLPEPADMRGIARPRAVYVGNLAAYRINLDWLLALSRARPDLQLVCIGAVGLGEAESTTTPLQQLASRANVYLLEPRAQADLPACLRGADVALIPFLDNHHTRGSLPLKLWEYVAAGLPVVATDLPNFREAVQAGAVRTAASTSEFISAVDAALGDVTFDPEAQSARARDHNWPARIDALAETIASAIHNTKQ